MPAGALILFTVGGLILLAGTAWWVAECFLTSAFWGWLSVFTFPFSNLVWLVFNPRRGWKPALVTAVGGAFLGIWYVEYGGALHAALVSAVLPVFRSAF